MPVCLCWHLLCGVTGGAAHEQANISPHEDRQAHLVLPSRHTRPLHHLQSQQQRRAYRLLRRFILHRQRGEGKVCTREHVLYLWGGGVIDFRTSIQKIAAQSTNEANLVDMSSCAKQGIYLCRILRELGWRTFLSARISCGNNKALLLAGQGRYSSRSKHLAIRFVGLRDPSLDHRREGRHRQRLNQGSADRHPHQVPCTTHLYRAA